jgi:spore coat polysaccharide biosynthesis protein SpsF
MLDRNTNLNIVAIVQARYNSSRLPGKVLLDIAGRPMLAWVIGRARRARCLSEVVVATTTDPSDDAVEMFCRQRGFPVTRGSQFDVLDRYYQAARWFAADVVVRLTADCPMMDPAEIDRIVAVFLDSGVDFAATRLPPPWKRTYPIGLDIEVCTFAGLERAWRDAVLPYEREHVMPYFYDEPGRFRIQVVDHSPDYGHLRWTVDTLEDLEAMRRLFGLFNGRDDFSWYELLAQHQAHPEMALINNGVMHKAFNDVDHRTQADAG